MKKVFSIIFCLIIFASLFAIEIESESKKDVKAGFSVSAQLVMSSKDYLVTPGDVYLLSYAFNGNPVSIHINVDATYEMRIGNFGVVKARGKTYLSIKKEIEEIVLRNYPMSGVQFTLVSPSVFKVTVKGEVKTVQEVEAWGLSRVSDVLSGLLTDYSSVRNITVYTTEGKQKKVDLFESKRNGDFTKDPFVRPGDTIIVQRMDRKVTISGEVERPGTYELLPGENLKELIEKYGNGITECADLSRIQIERVLSENSLSGEMNYLKANSIDDEIFNQYILQGYDKISIMSYSSLKPVLFIEGAVIQDTSKTGTDLLSSTKVSLNFEYGTNYAFFIRNHRDLFTSVSDLQKAYIIRGEEEIPINLEDILYDASFYSELTIENGDTLIIPFRQFFVTVSGAVYNPGRYPYIPNRTYEYYVSLAGGFIKSQNTGEAVKIFDTNGKKISKNSFIPPETVIEAQSNSFTYYFNQIGGVVSTILSIVLSSISIMIAIGK